MLLRGFKIGVLAVIAASTWIHPYLGALVSVAILLLACLIAGWSFRLTVFGSVFSWDLLTFRRKRIDTASESVWAFSAGRIGKIPVRTYGKLNCDLSGRLHFHYRPLLVFPWRSVRLPIGDYGLRKGAISPMVVWRVQGQQKHRSVLRLPPRYQSHEKQVASTLWIHDVQDGSIVKGFKAAIAWMKEIVGTISSKADGLLAKGNWFAS